MEAHEALRFHLGRFEISERKEVHASVPDFANDPVLIHAVKFGELEIAVDEDRGFHTLGNLFVPSGSKPGRSTDVVQNVNQPSRMGMGVDGALSVVSEYPNPVRLQFVPQHP